MRTEAHPFSTPVLLLFKTQQKSVVASDSKCSQQNAQETTTKSPEKTHFFKRDVS